MIGRKAKRIAAAAAACWMLTLAVFAQSVYTVQKGDSLWKIAEKNQVGLSELIKANPQLKNPANILPGQKITIPTTVPYASYEDQVLKLVNQQRASRGLQTLSKNWQLARVARLKSQDMAAKNYFSHQSPTYGSPFTMMQNFGLRFSAAGENIAMGQNTPQQVMTAWMNSPGHRANILSAAYTQLGVGVARNKSGVYYWTQDFMKPM